MFVTALLFIHAELPLLIFKSFEYKYKKEIKQLIKEGVPEKDLVHFTFHKSIIQNGAKDFKWIKKKEFRYKNEMYDVVKTEIKGDSVYYKCIHDFKESKLFANFDKYLIELLKNDSGKRNEFLTQFSSLNIYYLPSQQVTIDNHLIIRNQCITTIRAEESEGYLHILIPPPRS